MFPISELGGDFVPMCSPTKLDHDLRIVLARALTGLSGHIHLIISLKVRFWKNSAAILTPRYRPYQKFHDNPRRIAPKRAVIGLVGQNQ